MSLNSISPFVSSGLNSFVFDGVAPGNHSQGAECLEQPAHRYAPDGYAFLLDSIKALDSGGGYGLRVSLFEVNLQVQRSVQQANGQVLTQRAEMAFTFIKAKFDSAVEAPGEQAPFTGDFTPEAVAGRILDFSLSKFGTGVGNHTTEDTPESRQKYADYILPAIQKGFGDARAILGALTPEVEEGIECTWSLIQEGLGEFVQGEVNHTMQEKPS